MTLLGLHNPALFFLLFLLQGKDKIGGLFLREMEALNTTVSSDVMNWIYLTLVFVRNVVYNDLFFLGGEIRNGNHKLTTRSKWLPLQEKNSFFFSSAYLTHCSFMNFYFFFSKPGQAALVDVSFQVWESDLTSRKSLVCFVLLSFLYQPQFWAVSSEFWSRLDRWTSRFEGHTDFLKHKNQNCGVTGAETLDGC